MIRAAGNESAGPAVADFAATQQETTPTAYGIGAVPLVPVSVLLQIIPSGLFFCGSQPWLDESRFIVNAQLNRSEIRDRPE